MNDSIIKEIITTIGTVLVAFVTGMFSYKATKNKNNTKVSIKQHSFFARTEALKGEVLRNFEIRNKGKETVFKEIIVAQLSIFNRVLREFADSIEADNIKDETELYNRCISDFETIHRELYRFYLSNDSYTHDEKLVLEKIMNKYQNWNESMINHTKECILMICNSPFYSDINTKAAVILDSYMSITIDTINYAEKTFNNINGDLKGLCFREHVI